MDNSEFTSVREALNALPVGSVIYAYSVAYGVRSEYEIVKYSRKTCVWRFRNSVYSDDFRGPIEFYVWEDYEYCLIDYIPYNYVPVPLEDEIRAVAKEFGLQNVIEYLDKRRVG